MHTPRFRTTRVGRAAVVATAILLGARCGERAGDDGAGARPAPAATSVPAIELSHRAKLVRTLTPPVETVALLGADGHEASDAFDDVMHALDVAPPAAAVDPQVVLLVATEQQLRALDPAPIVAAVGRGVVLFVDAWAGDEAWLAQWAPGGRVRAVTADDDVLRKPDLLGTLPPAHSEPDRQIAGVERGGVLRVLATRQNTLCHSCGCDKMAGRLSFARNLAAHATGLAAEARPKIEPEIRIVGATIRGRQFHADVAFRNASEESARWRIDVLPIEGAPDASAVGTIAAGAAQTFALDATLTAPFDVLEHRIVARLERETEVLRAVEPLATFVGAPDLRVLATSEFGAGVPASARVLLSNSATGEPVEGADVALRLESADEAGREIASATATTDAHGTCDGRLAVPADAPATCRLVVTASTALTTESASVPITAWSELAAHLFVDLPVHRPGDRVQARAVVVREPSGLPQHDVAVLWALRGEDGRTVAYSPTITGNLGVTAGEVEIPGDTPTGDYVLELRAGNAQIGRAPLRIERFAVPRFRVVTESAAQTLVPGTPLAATVRADRFDGTALAAAEVTAVLRRGVWGAEPLARWQGITKDDGTADVRLDVPSDLDARLRNRQGDVVLDVSVRDAGGRTVRDALAFPSRAGNPRDVVLLEPDGGAAEGLPARILVRTEYAEGTEVEVAADDGPPEHVRVDAQGFVEVRVASPREGLPVRVGDVVTNLRVPARPVVLQVPHRVVAADAGIPFRVRTADAATHVFVDLLRENALLATFTFPVADRTARGDIVVPDGVFGPLTVQAYVVRGAGPPQADARDVYVVPPERLHLALTPDAPVVVPGAPVAIDARVTDRGGRGVAAALGVRVADEAVLSIVRGLPGCARVALALDAALRSSSDERTHWTASDLVQAAGRRDLTLGESRLADLLLSRGDRVVPFGVDVRTLPSHQAAARRRVEDRFAKFADAFPALVTPLLAGSYSPAPSQAVPNLASALRDIADAGGFGPEGLLDPWGTPLTIEFEGTIAFDWPNASPNGSANASPNERDFADMRLVSAGPDARRGTADDATSDVPWEHLLSMHALWVWRHGHRFDEKAFGPVPSAYASRRAGGGGRGFGSACGRSASLRDADAARDFVRTRRLFPEVAYFASLVVTDADGRARIDVVAPDALTTWRAEAVATDARGRAADGETRFRTALPFSVDVDPPETLVVGDEIEVPVLVRWAAAAGEPRADVQIAAAVSGGATLLSPATSSLVAPERGEAAGVVRVRADAPGALRIGVRCTSGGVSDALERVVVVVPAGRIVATSAPMTIGSEGATATLPRTSAKTGDASTPHRLELRLRPGMAGEVVEGVASLLAKPHGCFEQASSAVYPDVLAMSYLRRTDSMPPELREKFRSAIREGVDLLLSYEIPGGGFDWFGHPPAKLMLSAYGLHEWRDLGELWRSEGQPAEAAAADAVMKRCAAWIVAQQSADGAFAGEGVPYEWRRAGLDRVAATAYTGWALARCGDPVPGAADAVAKARAFVVRSIDAIHDPYALAIATAFLVETGPTDDDTLRVARRLAARGVRVRDEMRIGGGAGSAFHGRAAIASVEATALAALAAGRLDRDDVLPRAPLLAAVARDRRTDGTWGTTQATVLALWALLDGASGRIEAGTTVEVRPQGGAPRTITLTQSDLSRTVVVDLSDLPGLKGGAAPLAVTVTHDGAGDLRAALVLETVVPFATDARPAPSAPANDASRPAADAPLVLTVTRRTDDARAGAPIAFTLRLANPSAAPVAMPLVEIPLAAGFEADRASLDALRRHGDVARVEADARAVVVYLRKIAARAAFECTFAVTPRLRGRVTMFPCAARPYYDPDAACASTAQVIDVR